MTFFFRLLSHCPLWFLHALGAGMGWLAYGLSPSYRRRLRQHSAMAGVDNGARRAAIGQAGKLVAELPRLWMGQPVPARWTGDAHIHAAFARGRGLMFLTPHLGSFEAAAIAYAADFGQSLQPMTVLFRPPRKPWLRALVAAARTRPGLQSAPTTAAGVRAMVRALQRGQCVAILPDQVPPQGLGMWTPFFGQDAYTMTLSVRLATQCDATVLLAWGERLSWGRGFVVHVQPLSGPLSGDTAADVALVNRDMEALIRRHPQQYLWGYARYKQPRDEA
jgi:Kdo2-lipid IVA lauroyltransferase/acyltransferase